MYDSQCYDLAQSFLPSGASEKMIGELADEIQTTIETFMEYGEHKAEIRALEAEDRAVARLVVNNG